MITIKGNLLAVKQGFICYQVGCKGVFTSCLSRSMRVVWPKMFEDYAIAYQKGRVKLGEVIFTSIDEGKLYVATMCAQGDRNTIDGRSLDYPSFGICLRKVKDWYEHIGREKLPIYIPHMIGCGQAFGDWNTVKGIIKRETPNAIIVKL